MKLLFFLSLLAIGYLTGRNIEKRHFQSIVDREERYQHIPLIAAQWKDHVEENTEGQIFGGGVVIGADYFKSVVSGMRSVFGGRMSNYESLLDRGRREALLRMKAKADKWGAHKMINVRIETAVIGSQGGQKALPCVEIYAYGTAIRNKKDEIQA